jgi:hypothetical protein
MGMSPCAHRTLSFGLTYTFNRVKAGKSWVFFEGAALKNQNTRCSSKKFSSYSEAGRTAANYDEIRLKRRVCAQRAKIEHLHVVSPPFAMINALFVLTLLNCPIMNVIKANSRAAKRAPPNTQSKLIARHEPKGPTERHADTRKAPCNGIIKSFFE